MSLSSSGYDASFIRSRSRVRSPPLIWQSPFVTAIAASTIMPPSSGKNRTNLKAVRANTCCLLMNLKFERGGRSGRVSVSSSG